MKLAIVAIACEIVYFLARAFVKKPDCHDLSQKRL
jgi:hypothetical protein